MKDQKELYEILIGRELPRGWELEEQGPGDWFAYHVEVGACTRAGGTRGEAIEQAWDVVGGLRAHAESVALQRVRDEAAEALSLEGWALDGVSLNVSDDGFGFKIFSFSPAEWVDVWHTGPDICTAASVAIRAIQEGV